MNNDRKHVEVLKKEKILKKIFENSITGTTAHSESKFYLSIIKNIKSSKAAALKDDDLKSISSGIGFAKKLLASLTAFLSLMPVQAAALTTNPSVNLQSNGLLSYKKSQIDEYEDIMYSVNKMSDGETTDNLSAFEKKYEKLWKCFTYDMEYLFRSYEKKFNKYAGVNKSENRKKLAIYMHLDAFMKNHPEYFISFPDSFFSEIIYVKKLSDDEVLNSIETEKEKFEKLGTIENIKYFKIEKGLENSIDSRVFLLTIRKINNILEKYSKLTNQMLTILKKKNATFKIHSFDSDKEKNESQTNMYVINCYHTKKRNHTRLFNIFMSKNNLNDIEYASKAMLAETLSGFTSYVESHELTSSIVAHELGHIFENLMLEIVLHLATTKNLISPARYKYIDSKFRDNFRNKTKRNIIKIAKEKYGADNSKISEYGEKDSAEWFAEVFSNLECANEENISPYGKALRDVIKRFEDNTITSQDVVYLISSAN